MDDLRAILSQRSVADNEVQAQIREQIEVYKSDPSLLSTILGLIMDSDESTKNAAAVIFKYNFNANYGTIQQTEEFQILKEYIIQIIHDDHVLSVKEILLNSLLNNVKEEILEWPEIIELLDQNEDLLSLDFALSLALSLYEVLKIDELQQFAESYLNIISNALQIKSPSRNMSFKTSKLISRTVHIIPSESVSETSIQEYVQFLRNKFAEQYYANDMDCVQLGMNLEFSLSATSPLFDVEELLQTLVSMTSEEENDYKWVPMKIIGRMIKVYGPSLTEHFSSLFELSINVAVETVADDISATCIILRVVKRIAQLLSPNDFLEFLQQISESLTGDELSVEFIFCSLLILDITIEVFGENVIIIQDGVLPILSLCFESDNAEVLEKAAETAKELAAYAGNSFDLNDLFAKILALAQEFADAESGDIDKLGIMVGYISRFLYSSKSLSLENIVASGSHVVGWIEEFGLTQNFIYCLVECISALSPHFKVADLSNTEDPMIQLATSSYDVVSEVLSDEESLLIPPAIELVGALIASASTIFEENLQEMLEQIIGQLQTADVDHLDAAYTSLIRITIALGKDVNPYIEAGLIRAGDIMTHIERNTMNLIYVICDFIKTAVKKEADGIKRWAPALIFFLSVLSSTETDLELYDSAMPALIALAVDQEYDTDEYLDIALERIEFGGEWAATSFNALKKLLKGVDDLSDEQLEQIFQIAIQTITRSLPAMSKSGRFVIGAQQFPSCVREAYKMLACFAASYHDSFDIGSYLEAISFTLEAGSSALEEEPSDEEKMAQLAPLIAFLSSDESEEAELAAAVLPRALELISSYDRISDPAPIELGRAIALVLPDAVGPVVEATVAHLAAESPIAERINAAIGASVLSLWLKYPPEVTPVVQSVLQQLPARGSRENVLNMFNAVIQAAESLPEEFALMLETVKGFLERSFEGGFVYSLDLPEETVSLIEQLRTTIESQN